MYHNINVEVKKSSRKMVKLTQSEFMEKLKDVLCTPLTEDTGFDFLSESEFDALSLEEKIFQYIDGSSTGSFDSKRNKPFCNWMMETETIYTEGPINFNELAKPFKESYERKKTISDIETLIDSGTPLLGYQEFGNVSFIGFISNDCEECLPYYTIIYWDGKVIKYYIPTKGNVVYPKVGLPFGSYYLADGHFFIESGTADNLFLKYKMSEEDEETLLVKMFREELLTRVDKSLVESVDVLALPIELHWESIKEDILTTFA